MYMCRYSIPMRRYTRPSCATSDSEWWVGGGKKNSFIIYPLFFQVIQAHGHVLLRGVSSTQDAVRSCLLALRVTSTMRQSCSLSREMVSAAAEGDHWTPQVGPGCSPIARAWFGEPRTRPQESGLGLAFRGEGNVKYSPSWRRWWPPSNTFTASRLRPQIFTRSGFGSICPQQLKALGLGSGVVRGGPEVRFHTGSTRVPRGSTRVPPGFHQGSTRVPRRSARAAGWCERCKENCVLLGMSPELIFWGGAEKKHLPQPAISFWGKIIL